MTAPTTTELWKPGPLRRFGDRMLRRVLRKGKGPEFLSLLTVEGRSSGLPRTTPVAPVQDDGRVWLVSAFGDVDWVRNVRASGAVELQRGDERTAYGARELDAHDATPVLRAYLSMPSERFVRREFEATRSSTDAAIAAEVPRHPVFELTPRSA